MKRKKGHKQKRNQVFVEMIEMYGTKSVAHKSKKDYNRKPKFGRKFDQYSGIINIPVCWFKLNRNNKQPAFNRLCYG